MTTQPPAHLTLTTALEAALDEVEAAALAATAGPWWYDPTKVNSVDRGEAVFAGERGLAARPSSHWPRLTRGCRCERVLDVVR